MSRYKPNPTEQRSMCSDHLTGVNMVPLTKPQRAAVHRKWSESNQDLSYKQFRSTAFPMCFGDGAIVIQWCNMLLAIETDGHTHS
jgi:hypothetical protein